MGCKWQMSGSEGIVRLHPGVAHGFTMLPGLVEADEANKVIAKFIHEKLAE